LSKLIRLGVFALICYLGITALIGFQLGRQVYQAKTNPLIRLGSQMIGRDATESFAIRRANVPIWVTDSPTFRIGMRISE
jgi:hypothetical protein